MARLRTLKPSFFTNDTLDAYNTALGVALDTAKDDATVLLRGERARGGVR